MPIIFFFAIPFSLLIATPDYNRLEDYIRNHHPKKYRQIYKPSTWIILIKPLRLLPLLRFLYNEELDTDITIKTLKTKYRKAINRTFYIFLGFFFSIFLLISTFS